MKPIPPIFISMLLILWFPLYSQNDIRHSFFIAGPQFTGIIGEKGEEIWNSGKPGARDGYVLPNGHILICWADEVIEYSRKKNIVFQYKRASPDMELGTAVRLKNGNTLITESGKKPRLIEVDKKAAIKISVPLEPETENTHMQTRMARKLESGNYLVPHLLAFAVKEYSPKGNIIKVFLDGTLVIDYQDNEQHGKRLIMQEFNGTDFKIQEYDFTKEYRYKTKVLCNSHSICTGTGNTGF